MKKIIWMPFIFSFFILISCEEQEVVKEVVKSKVIFYVPNAGTARVWASVSVEIEGKSGSFLSRESQNMTVSGCDNTGFSTTIELMPGTYNYVATSSGKTWKGTVKLEENVCQPVGLNF